MKYINRLLKIEGIILIFIGLMMLLFCMFYAVMSSKQYFYNGALKSVILIMVGFPIYGIGEIITLLKRD